MSEGLLLDTCAAIWLANGVELSPESVAEIEDAARRDNVFLSPVTAWEVALLSQKGRIAMTMAPPEWYRRMLALPGVSETDLTAEVMIDSVDLPEGLHKDPADRMLIATARRSNFTIVTRDRAILGYAAKGFLHAMAC